MTEKFTKKRVTIQYDDPNAREVYLVGTFNGWNLSANPMKKNRAGTWTTTLNLVPGSYEYLFLVDGEFTEDPDSRSSVPNRFDGYNSEIIVE
jgi:1,4-alpha-glucan branching enzyme